MGGLGLLLPGGFHSELLLILVPNVSLTRGQMDNGWTWSPVGFHTVNYYCADCAGIEVVLMSQMQNGHGLQLSVDFHKTVRCSPGSGTWSPISFWLLQNY